MQDTSSKTTPPAEASRLARQEALLGQLRPVEEIVEAARREIAQHRAACRAAEAAGTADPEQVKRAEAAAVGVEELIARFESMADEISGTSGTIDGVLDQLHQSLEQMRAQITGVVQRLEKLD